MSQPQELKNIIRALPKTEAIGSLQTRLDQAGIAVDLHKIPAERVSDSFRDAMYQLLERPLGELTVKQIRAITEEVRAIIQKEDGKSQRGRRPQEHALSPSEVLVNLPPEITAVRNEILRYFQNHYTQAQILIERYLQTVEGVSLSSVEQSQSFVRELNEMVGSSGLRLLDPDSGRPGYLFASKGKASRVAGGYFRLRYAANPSDSKRDTSRAFQEFPRFGIASRQRRLELPSDITGELRVEAIRAINEPVEEKAKRNGEQTKITSPICQPVQPISNPTTATPSEALVNLPPEITAVRNEILRYFQNHYMQAQILIERYLQTVEGASFSSYEQSQSFVRELNEMVGSSGLRLLDPDSGRPGYLFVSKGKASKVAGGYFRLRNPANPSDSKRYATRAFKEIPRFGIASRQRRLELPSDITLDSDKSEAGLPMTDR